MNNHSADSAYVVVGSCAGSEPLFQLMKPTWKYVLQILPYVKWVQRIKMGGMEPLVSFGNLVPSSH